MGPQDGSTNWHERIWPEGYTFLVKDGADITVNVPSYDGLMADTFSVEYSEPQMPATSITMTVTGDSALEGGPCSIQSDHLRTYFTEFGPFVSQSGAWWDCKTKNGGEGWPTTSTIQDFKDQLEAVSSTFPSPPDGPYSVKGGEDTVHKLIDDIPLPTPQPPAPLPTPQPSAPLPPPSSPTVPKQPTPTPTKKPTASTCGYVPDGECGPIINYMFTELKGYKELYPDFESITGVSRSVATIEDMEQYVFCTEPGDSIIADCKGLQARCEGSQPRPCGVAGPAPTNIPKAASVDTIHELIDDIPSLSSPLNMAKKTTKSPMTSSATLEAESTATTDDSTGYTLSREWKGSSFFEGWEFSTVDKTGGIVDYGDYEDLAFFNEATKSAIIKVDNTGPLKGILCCYSSTH